MVWGGVDCFGGGDDWLATRMVSVVEKVELMDVREKTLLRLTNELHWLNELQTQRSRVRLNIRKLFLERRIRRTTESINELAAALATLRETFTGWDQP